MAAESIGRANNYGWDRPFNQSILKIWFDFDLIIF